MKSLIAAIALASFAAGGCAEFVELRHAHAAHRARAGCKARRVLSYFCETTDIFPTIAALAHAKEPLPEGIEGGSLALAFSGATNITVNRAREEFVVHFPHYDKDEQGSASAILLGSEKLIHPYETNVPMLFDLAKDIGEQHDLAKDRAKETAALEQRMNEYLKAVGAQMAVANPKFDPSKAQPFQERRGTKGRMKPEAQ